MKRFIKNISLAFLTLVLFNSCSTEESYELISPEASFTMNAPAINSVYLNFSQPNSPALTLTWEDEVTESNSYTIEMSLDDEFNTANVLGTSNTNSFTINAGDLNTAITSVYETSYRDIAIYVRISTGSEYSNSSLLLITTYPVGTPTFNGINDGDVIVLDKALNGDVALTMGWDDPILNSTLNVNKAYFLEAATPGTDFATPIEIIRAENTGTVDLTHSSLNSAAIKTGVSPDTSGDVEIRIRSLVTDLNTNGTLERISDPITVNISTYLTVLDLSTTWGIIGSGANDWGATPDLPFWKTDVGGVLVAYVNLIDGEIKFRENNDWTNNYGDTGADGTLDPGGANIAVTEGSYKITMDLNNLTYTMEEFSLGIVGAVNGWNPPDVKLEYDQYSDVFRGIVTLPDGEHKFRLNNDWGTNWGDNGADGTMEEGGANIATTAGIYIVTVDLNNLEYTLEPINYVWGIVGSGYNDWGNAGPDAMFTRDWSQPFDEIWILENVTLLDGEIKFRANQDWGVNYGDTGADGTLEEGGSNIVTTAGTYTITLDFSNPNSPTYTIQ